MLVAVPPGGGTVRGQNMRAIAHTLAFAMVAALGTGTIAATPQASSQAESLPDAPTAPCTGPEAAKGATSIGLEPTELGVLVVADMSSGIDLGAAGGLVDAALAEAFNPLRVQVRLRWQTVRLGAETLTLSAALQAARDATGGAPPEGADVVYLLTGAELTTDQGAPISGGAACIGGIAEPGTAYAAGLWYADDAEPQGVDVPEQAALQPQRVPEHGLQDVPEPRDHVGETPGVRVARVGWFENWTGKVLVHQLGHLLGAHHELANCAEGVPSRTTDDVTGTCTAMAPEVAFASANFSVANGLLVAAHVRAHAGG